MANCITRHIPNAVTCANLFSGCIACVMAFRGNFEAAFLFIILGAVFDFFDGMLARALKAYSPMGKELDSLADDITFGLAPAMMAFRLLTCLSYPRFLEPIVIYLPYLAFFIAVFSALRLGKFNIDERQTSSFIGLPTPANALFWGSLCTGLIGWIGTLHAAWVLILGLIFLSCYLLTAEIPMFSLKFHDLKWSHNRWQFIFLAGCLVMLIFLGYASFAAIIVWYIILSIAHNFASR